MRFRRLFAAAAVLGAQPAFAQTEPAEPTPPKNVRVVYKEVEEITFEPVKITGEKTRVPGLLFLSRADEKYPSMIEERAHFKRDLAKSAGFVVKSSESEAK